MAETDTIIYDSNVLTEEMIDAAMNNKFKNLSKELIVDDDERRNNSNSEDGYSSDYDCQVETIESDSPIFQDESMSANNGNNIDVQINKTNVGPIVKTLLCRETNIEPKRDDESNSVPIIDKTTNQKTEPNEKGLLKLKPITHLLKDNVANNYSKQENKIKVYTRVNGKIQLLENTTIMPPKKNPFMSVNHANKTSSDSSVNSEYCTDDSDSDNSSICEITNNGNRKFNDLNTNDHSYVRKSKVVKTKNNTVGNFSGGNKIVDNKFQGNGKPGNMVRNNLIKPTICKVNVMKNRMIDKIQSKTLLLSKSVNSKQFNGKPTNVNINQDPEIINCSDSDDNVNDDGSSDDEVKNDVPSVKLRNVSELTAPSTSGINTPAVKKMLQSMNKSSVTEMHTQPSGVYRRPILPKICYRYHTNDKVVIADKLPKNAALISVNNSNKNSKVNVFKISDINAPKSVVIMAPDKAAGQPTALSSHSVFQIAAKSKYLRNVINTVASPSTSVPLKIHNLPKTNTISLLKAPVSAATNAGRNWEKLDRITLNIDEQTKSKETMERLIKSQILERVLPPYKPPEDATANFSCLECGDRFVMGSSYQRHKYRRSIFIVYWCRICSSSLNLYNRCMFLSHLRAHNQLFKNIDMSCVSISSLPTQLLGFGSLVERDTSSNAPEMPDTDTLATLLSSSNENNLQLPTNSIDACNVEEKSNAVGINNVQIPAKQVLEDSSNKDMDTQTNHTELDVIMIDSNEIDKSPSNQDTVSPNNVEEIISTNLADPVKDSTDIKTGENMQLKTKIQPDKPIGRKRVCPECGIQLTAKITLRKHLQNYNKPLTDNFKCSHCNLILQSHCSLIMHRRIHKKMTPFRCPDCALEFSIFDRFLMHLKFTCCHLTKVVRYVCSLCNIMQTTSGLLEQHLMTRHVRSVFKCGVCPIAFVNTKGLEKHREKEHPNINVQIQPYQQCKLCPEKLIPRKKFLVHMKTHLNDDKIRIYAFQCPSCKFTFFHRTELIYHRMKCESKAGIIKSVLDFVPAADNSFEEDCASRNVDEQEIEVPPTRKERLNNDGMDIHEEEQDPLCLKDFQAEVVQEPSVQTCIVCKTEKVLILPGKNQSSQSLCCKKCVSPCGLPTQRNNLAVAQQKKYKCNICQSSDYMTYRSTFAHFKDLHKNLEGKFVNDWMTIEKNTTAVSIKSSNTVSTAKTIKEKYKGKRPFSTVANSSRKTDENSENELANTPDSSPEKKRPKRLLKSKQKNSGKKSIESEELRTENNVSSGFSCSKCDFQSENKLELRKHVISHRTDPNALQCLECGECFIVLPSLEKHLIINHGISDVNNYIADEKPSKSSEVEDESIGDNETGNKCKVCCKVFSSRSVLNKHFRSHGMAFLFKTK